MSSLKPAPPTPPKPLRLWPGVVVALLLVTMRYLVPAFAPGALFYGIMGAFAGTLLILLWWLLLSRAAWWERLGALAVGVAGMALTFPLLHVSVARGNMGKQFILHAVPVLGLALVVGALIGRRLAPGRRFAVLAACLVAACGAWTLVRSNGVSGNGMAEFRGRWTETAEERLLAAAGGELRPAALTTGEAELAGVQWPGLRGADRDGIVRGLRIATDWSKQPPVELWRRPIGPAVSSFAVAGKKLYTQEQRGDDELVTAYHLETGEPLWQHQDAARFWDAHVGAGPRATPAVAGGRVYTLGATGILNALDAATGALVWSRNAAADGGGKAPLWGFVSSPLVVGDLLIVQAGTLVAYELATGEPRWFGPKKRGSYSSPHLLSIAGVPQILLLGHGATFSLSPADGSLLWEHPWPGIGIVQPAVIADGELLVSLIDDGASPIGTRRIKVANGAAGWKAEERWTSRALKPSFSDVVAHQGRAYGVDGRILACIDLETGERVWKGGRYGEAQLLLFPDQDLLLVLSEEGELALVAASPEGFRELARLPALGAKTWSQPALAGDVLLVRNGEEMAAFRLPVD